MKLKCPKCSATKEFIRHYGHFFRKSDSRTIRRYKCQKCSKHFSSATFSSAYKQKKRRLNHPLYLEYCSNTSQRRMALKYGISRTTVARKVKFLSLVARESFDRWRSGKTFSHIQFDDLETIQHTKLKPVTVTVIISKKCRKIIDFEVAEIKSKGHLAKISLKKYGPRIDKSFKARKELFRRVSPFIEEGASVDSDFHPQYTKLVSEYLENAHHTQYKGGSASISGQGELKKMSFDPLFSINHSLAMLRANIHRLVRRTWNTTKCIECLRDHLYIYADFHNRVLTPNLP